MLSVPVVVLAAVLAAAPQGSGTGASQSVQTPAAQSAERAPAEPQNEAPAALPVSIDRIQEALSRPPALKLESVRPVFRVEVFARKPTLEDLLGPNYLIGPVPYGGMTHQEFLNMVTPVEFRGYSMFTNKEGITIAATSLALQWALMKAVDKLRDARSDRAKEAARREVLDAMNELEAARKKAGLPPK